MSQARDSNGSYVYVYCVIRCERPPQIATLGIGERGDAVYTVRHDDLAAVVSDSPTAEYEARRRNMMAHTAVLEEVMRDFSILPVRFGSVAPDTEVIRRKLLAERRDELLGLLQEIDGRVELGLKAFWHEDTLFKGIVDENPRIRMLRDALKGRSAEETHHERMKLGEMVEEAMKQRRKRDADVILNRLRPVVRRLVVNDVFGDRMVLNAAMLVDKGSEPMVDETVQQLDADLGQRLMFKYVGSLPPYNFVKLVVLW